MKKNARVIAVKVLEGALQSLSCGGAWSQVMAGIDWSYKDAIEKGIIKQSVINMSLGEPIPSIFLIYLSLTISQAAVSTSLLMTCSNWPSLEE